MQAKDSDSGLDLASANGAVLQVPLCDYKNSGRLTEPCGPRHRGVVLPLWRCPPEPPRRLTLDFETAEPQEDGTNLISAQIIATPSNLSTLVNEQISGDEQQQQEEDSKDRPGSKMPNVPIVGVKITVSPVITPYAI